jgi:hypothetical protein
MNHAVVMGSDVMIYIPSFIKIRSGIQKLIWGGGFLQKQYGDLIILLLLIQNKESR